MITTLGQAAEKFLHLTNRLRRLGPGTAPPKEAHISPSLLAFLEFLSSTPRCGIQEMAAGLNLSTPTVSIGVRQLEDAGFVTRKPDPQDGRAVQLFLTSKGQKLHQRTQEFRRQKFERLLIGLTPQERSTLLDLLERAIQAAENENQGDTR